MAVVGGTTSVITGGKFANGAESGAFVHLFNAEGETFSRIWKGLTGSMNTLNDRRGEILSDAGKGLRGGLDGYRAVRDNRSGDVPVIARGMLRVGITSVELGLTSWIKDPLLYIYVNVNSGFALDTIPLNSVALSSNIVGNYAD
jgi:hypothetical protein